MIEEQQTFFGDLFNKDPNDEWQHMPEFHQEKQEPFGEVIVRFRTEDDFDRFAILVNQRMSEKTKSIWYPKITDLPPSRFRYVEGGENDES